MIVLYVCLCIVIVIIIIVYVVVLCILLYSLPEMLGHYTIIQVTKCMENCMGRMHDFNLGFTHGFTRCRLVSATIFFSIRQITSLALN